MRWRTSLCTLAMLLRTREAEAMTYYGQRRQLDHTTDFLVGFISQSAVSFLFGFMLLGRFVSRSGFAGLCVWCVVVLLAGMLLESADGYLPEWSAAFIGRLTLDYGPLMFGVCCRWRKERQSSRHFDPVLAGHQSP